MAPGDRWIAWSREQHARNLQFVVNNSRSSFHGFR
jgi:hypothetical protein